MRRMYSKPQLLEAVESESKINGIKVFEDIKDKNGNPRFLEGDINLDVAVPSGITKTYGKWALSGSHLLIVLAIDVENGITVPPATILSVLDLPQWIVDKIVPLFSVNVFWDTTNFYSEDSTIQYVPVLLRKQNDKINITTTTFTTTAIKHARIAFDLLIDNE